MTEKEFIRAAANAINAETPEDAAKAVYEVCVKAATEWGMKPDVEVSLRRPGDPRHHDAIDCWAVIFEAGPYQWAVTASLSVPLPSKVLAEPYYSFDLCFYPA
jgi:hypothetical protein